MSAVWFTSPNSKKVSNIMTIKSVYEKVHHYLNPKPQIIEKRPSNEKIDAVVEYYKRRYGWVFFLRYFFKVQIPGKNIMELAVALAYTFAEGCVGIFKVLWTPVAFALLIAALPVLFVWGCFSKLFELIFGGILAACREDNKIIHDSMNPFEQEKENVCGTWRFTASCKNCEEVPMLEGFATGAYSYNACEDVRNQIKAFIEPLMVGELNSSSSDINTTDFTINIDYTVINHYPTPAMGSDEV